MPDEQSLPIPNELGHRHFGLDVHNLSHPKLVGCLARFVAGKAFGADECTINLVQLSLNIELSRQGEERQENQHKFKLRCLAIPVHDHANMLGPDSRLM